jgi:formate/nitrite transporter
LNPPAEIAKNYIPVGAAKARLPAAKMLLLSVLAGMFIALAGAGATAAPATVESASLAKLLGACIFPAGLSMVVLAGSELFTGNNLMIIPLLEREITLGAMLKNWVLVYIGNLLGSVLVAAAVVYGHVFSLFGGALAEAAVSAAVAKVGLSLGDAFIRGVMCNFLVCIAVWIAMGAKSAPGKVIGLFFPIMLFVLLGFEHSVANMYYIPAGILAAAEYGIDAPSLTWGAFLVRNLLPVTLGNIVGGSGLVGCVCWFCYLRGTK